MIDLSDAVVGFTLSLGKSVVVVASEDFRSLAVRHHSHQGWLLPDHIGYLYSVLTAFCKICAVELSQVGYRGLKILSFADCGDVADLRAGIRCCFRHKGRAPWLANQLDCRFVPVMAMKVENCRRRRRFQRQAPF